jgi:hypothetical protein
MIVIGANFFADDYDGNRFFAGPYSGRPRALHSAVRGVLLDPNNELPRNFFPFSSCALELRSRSLDGRCFGGRWFSPDPDPLGGGLPERVSLFPLEGFIKSVEV